MTEVGVAYVNIVPKTDDFSATVAKASEDAGKAGGSGISGGIFDSLQSTVGDLFGTGGEMGSALSGGMESFLGGAGKYAIGAAVAAIGVEALVQLEKIGAEIDEMTDEIIVGTGASGAQLEEMRQIAMGMSRDVAVSFAESGDIVQDFNTRLGLSGDDLQTVATHAAQLDHILGGIDYDNMATMFNVWGVGADSMTDKMDYMFGVAQSTGIGFDQLTGIMQSSGPVLQNMGFSFEESANMAGLLDKAGIDASSTMGKMSKALVTMAQAGEPAPETFRRVVGEMQDFIDAGDTASALDIASEVFGTKGAAQFVGALQSGALNLDTISDSALGAGASIEETYAATEDWPEQWTRIQNSVKSALEPLGSAVFGALGTALETIGEGLTFLWEASAPVRDAFAEVADGIGQRLQPVIEAISPGLGALGDILGGAVKLGFEAIATAVQTVGDVISWVWDNILAPFGEWLESTFGPIVQGVGDFFSGAADVIGGAMEWANGAVTTYGDSMVQTMGGDWQAMALNTSSTFQGIQGNVDTAMSTASNKADAASQKINTAMNFPNTANNVGNVFNEAAQNMQKPVDDAVDDINAKPGEITSAYYGLGSSITSAIGTIDFPQPHVSYRNETVGEKTVSFPVVNYYASGGFVDGAQLLVAGEAGPEMILPERGGLMDRFTSALSEKLGGGRAVNIYLQYDASADATALASDLAMILNRKLAMEA